nr:membrane protein [Microbacterium indicum]
MSGLIRGIRIASLGALALRLARLVGGLVLYGAGCALTVEAGLGVDPWTVLAEGIAHRTGIGVGWVTNIVGAIVLLAWIPLRQRLGVGTVLNVLVVGTSMQIVIDLVPAPATGGWRVAPLAGGILLVALASAIYIGARLGAGPRDGLMTGLSARFGWPIWRSRATVEVTVLAAGLLLGGTAGWGTLAFALLIGPLVHASMRLLRVRPAPSSSRVARTGNTLGPWVRSSPSARSTS